MTLRQDLDQVAVTAQWMAAERARESGRPDRLFDDPYAEVLAGVEGRAMLAEMAAPGDATSRTIPIRTRFFDDALLRLMDAGRIDQVVMLAAGMDTRAFRLPLPADLTLFELDRPELLALKEARLAERSARARCRRVTIGADLASDWADHLRAAGFRPRPTIWVAEGLLVYLDVADVHHLLEAIGALSDPRDWLLTDIVGQSLLSSPQFDAWLDAFARKGMPWRFGSDDPEGLLGAHGWTAEASQYGDDDANFGRWPWPPAPRDDAGWPRSYLVRAASRGDAVRTDRRRGMRRAAQAPRPPR